MALPTTRAARNAILDALAALVEGLTVTDADGDTYTVSAMGRPPAPGTLADLPAVGLVMSLATPAIDEPREVPGSRSPSEGAGVYLEQMGQLDASVQLHILAEDEVQEDEIAGALEQALLPEAGALRKRIVLTSADYFGAAIAVSYTGTQTFPVPQATDLWRTVVTVDASCPLLRQPAAADLNPVIGLTVDGDGEYTFDTTDGTTTPPDPE